MSNDPTLNNFSNRTLEKDDETAPTPPTEETPMLTQKEVDRIIGRTRLEARERAQNELVTELGVSSWEEVKSRLASVTPPPAEKPKPAETAEESNAQLQLLQELKREIDAMKQRDAQREEAERQRMAGQLRQQIAEEKQLPAALVGKLTGTTEEEILAEAEELQAALKAYAESNAIVKPKPPITHASEGTQSLPSTLVVSDDRERELAIRYPSAAPRK